MSIRIDNLRAAAGAEAKSARAIAETAMAAGRDLSAAEQSTFDGHMAKAYDHLDSLKSAKSDRDILAQARALADEIDGGGSGRRKTGRSPWAKSTAELMDKALTGGIDGEKSLVSGSIGVAVPLVTDIVTLSDAPRTLLDLIPVKPLAGGFGTGNSYSYLKQTVRTNNAAPVADNAVKPTTVYTITEVEDRCRVIAHLTEPTPIRYFADHENLERFLESELEAGLYQALETQIVSGDGLGENFEGILATSGIITQAFTVDALTSIRKAITSLEVIGVIPTALVLNPTDAEALDLLRDSGATGRYLLADPAGDGGQSLWSIPRVRSNAVAAGTAILADWTQSELVVREGATLAVDRSGVLFTKNQAILRLEGRFGFAAHRPGAFAEIHLAAA